MNNNVDDVINKGCDLETGLEIGEDFLFDYIGLIAEFCEIFLGLSNVEVAKLFKKYKVASYINEMGDYFNSYGPQGIAQDIKEYIEHSGGDVYEHID